MVTVATTTLIDDITDDCLDEQVLDISNPKLTVMDQSVSIDGRIKCLELYYDQVGDECVELVGDMINVYHFGGTDSSQQLLYKACTTTSLSPFLKIIMAQGLFLYHEDVSEEDDEDFRQAIEQSNQNRRSLAFDALNCVCSDMTGVPIVYKMEAICTLMESPKHQHEADSFFREIIRDSSLSSEYRYRFVLSLEKLEVDNRNFFIVNACTDMLSDELTDVRIRILASQKLLADKSIAQEMTTSVSHMLLDIAEDSSVEYNARADAADTLLGLGVDEVKERARDVILELGRQFGDAKTLYQNAQNVHNTTIEESVMEIIDYLITIPILEDNGILLTFEKVRSYIEELAETRPDDDKDKINISLNRLEMDRQLYSLHSMSLRAILVRVWSLLAEHSSCEDIKNRLLEELIDMSGTCSSGFVERLANVISGYTDYGLRISWNDQITANMSGRLNVRMRDICASDSVFRTNKLVDVVRLWIEVHESDACTLAPRIDDMITKYMFEANSDNAYAEIVHEFLSENREERIDMCLEWFEECVMDEITLPTSQWEERRRFLLFFRTHLSSIRDELYEEFKEYITDTCFDLGFRVAICTYEGENY